MRPNNRYQSRRVQKWKTPKWPFVLVGLCVLGVAAGAFALSRHVGKTQTDTAQTQTPAAQFDKTKYSTTDPTSIWVIVNKKHPLNPKTYAPADLRTPNIDVESKDMQVNSQMATALETMAAAAEQEGIEFTLASAYRSYAEQTSVYTSVVRGYGQEEADRQSARAGYSEHQSGWAADLGAANGKCRIEACFADTPEGKWLAANAYKYGFIIRYLKEKESVTGYQYEPWHVRYIGTELAAEMHRTGITTLEEFFGLPAAPDY